MTPQLWAKPKYTKCPKCGTEFDAEHLWWCMPFVWDESKWWNLKKNKTSVFDG